ncbi:hypothetical protein X566_20075 [Afipia sp. P52-10]|uniref:transcription termination/antitermination protein NusG n=1 Tax=Afipia sp. P52-10 TaxID=1429916 RepID=UPI0003DF00BE|nr:transcription termination/antitermination NusG family protein [Afipia sp. P52-10]ETR75908.1 hypothetical protein X566_20075 [Afipia sp. P52-10]
MTMVLKIGDFVDFVDCAGDVLAMPVPHRWYLLRTHPNKEFVVFGGLFRRGFTAYVPSFQASRPTGRMENGKRHMRTLTRPVFPGIVFVPDFDANLDALRLVDGVVGFVKFGEERASMSVGMMADVRRLETFMNLPPKAQKGWAPTIGSLVRVTVAHNVSLTGRIERLDGQGRLRVLIDAMKREIAVTATVDQVEPA